MAHAKRLVAILPLLLAVIFCSGIALAQTVTITQTQRDDIDPGRDPLSINRAECLANGVVEVTVTVNIAGLDDPQLEVWGGTGTCSDDETRNQLNSTQCWRIFSNEAENQTIPLRIQDMVRRPTQDGENVCDQSSGQFTVWFLLVSGTENQTANEASLKFKFDLSGPNPPALTSIRSGENSLVVRWDSSNTNDVDGYRIYCEEADDSEPSGTGGSGGGSATGGSGGAASGSGGGGGTLDGSGGTEATGGATEGGTSSGGASGSAAASGATSASAGRAAMPDNGCRGARLRAGEVPPEELRAGTASQASREGTAKGLANGRTYACGVAAYDDDDNLGELSNMLCERPRPVIDYFEAYRRAGGSAGGGYCSFGRAPTTHALGALAGLGVLALALRRRSRRSVP